MSICYSINIPIPRRWFWFPPDLILRPSIAISMENIFHSSFQVSGNHLKSPLMKFLPFKRRNDEFDSSNSNPKSLKCADSKVKSVAV